MRKTLKLRNKRLLRKKTKKIKSRKSKNSSSKRRDTELGLKLYRLQEEEKAKEAARLAAEEAKQYYRKDTQQGQGN